MLHYMDEKGQRITSILFSPPYSLGPVSHALGDFAVENAVWCSSMLALMRYLMVASDKDILAIRGVGPAGLKRIREAVRVAQSDPWYGHAEAVSGVRL